MPTFIGDAPVKGGLALTKQPQSWPMEPSLRDILKHGFPRPGLGPGVARWRFKNLPHLMRGLRRVFWAKVHRVPTHYGVLYLDVFRGDGTREALGLASLRVVTDVGCQKIVAVMNASDAATGTTFKFHGFGSGSTAEAAADTALVTEFTTEYAVDNTRPTGSQTTGGSTKVYRTVGTFSPDATPAALREHGAFSASSAGSLLDRSVYAAINLTANQDSLQATYDLTFTSGG